ncbi:MAG: SH3 domain-containing protein [Anaerolineae bacterium]|nr:SH3 domain-containing protein [Anaerolineae bacterium]
MFKRTYRLALMLFVLLMIPVVIVSAQEPPDAINDALADLSARVGQNLTLDDLSTWNWSQTNYPDTSLGCPQPDEVYAQVLTTGYRFEFIYNGAYYDYRVSADRSILFLCTNPPAEPESTEAVKTPAPATTPVTIAPPATVEPTIPGRVVCAGAMPTRLIAGTQATARDNEIPKNIRSAPNTTSAILGQIPGGGVITILDGPECAENMVWWQVDYDTLVGWVSEGQNGIYWFEPLAQAPDVSPAPADETPAPAPAIPVEPQPYDLPSNRQAITPTNAPLLVRFVELTINEEVTALDWSPDGGSLAASGATGIWLYSTAGFTLPPRLLQDPNGPVYDVAFSPDRTTMATAHNDASVRVWNVVTGGQQAVLRDHAQPVLAVAFSPDGSLLASGAGNLATGEGGAIRLWDTATSTQIAVLSEHTAPVTTLSFCPDGTFFVSGSLDTSVRLWDAVSATLAITLSGHSGPVRAIACSPDANRIASGGDDGLLYLWDPTTGDQVALEGHAGSVLALAFNPVGDILASGGGRVDEVGDSSLHLWDPNAETQLAVLSPDDLGAAPDAVITGITFSPDGTALVVCLFDGQASTIQLWGITP